MGDVQRWLPALLTELERWSPLGDRRFDTGGRIIGYLSAKGGMAWLHRLYPPIEPSELAAAEQAMGRPIPGPFADFLRAMNGGWLFFRLFSVYGYVAQLRRDLSSPLRQPVSLRYGNVVERAKRVPEAAFCIGALAGQQIVCHYYMMPDGSVRLVRTWDGSQVAAAWNSVEEMMLSEVRRLGKLHDGHGNLLVGAHEIWPERALAWDKP